MTRAPAPAPRLGHLIQQTFGRFTIGNVIGAGHHTRVASDRKGISAVAAHPRRDMILHASTASLRAIGEVAMIVAPRATLSQPARRSWRSQLRVRRATLIRHQKRHCIAGAAKTRSSRPARERRILSQAGRRNTERFADPRMTPARIRQASVANRSRSKVTHRFQHGGDGEYT